MIESNVSYPSFVSWPKCPPEICPSGTGECEVACDIWQSYLLLSLTFKPFVSSVMGIDICEQYSTPFVKLCAPHLGVNWSFSRVEMRCTCVSWQKVKKIDVTFLECNVCGHIVSSICLQGNVTFVYPVTWSQCDPISPPPLSLLPPPIHLYSLPFMSRLLLFFLYLETNKFPNWEVTPKSCRYPISLQNFFFCFYWI